jgi:hypothetical protein
MISPWRALSRQPIDWTGDDQQLQKDADAQLWITLAVYADSRMF